jgi:hypothetical protein
VPLSAEDERFMLDISDTGDLTRDRVFPALLAGYRLPSAEYYVFAVTWAAPEVERAGCVWTHSLLLSAEQVPALRDARVLLACFRRPTANGKRSTEPYLEQLRIDQPRNPRSGEAHELTATILWGTYEPPAPPVISQDLTLDSESRHELLLDIWSQQWPGLRLVFAFAESPMTPRQRNDRTLFDLQVMHLPPRGLREEVPNLRFVNRALDSPPTWARWIADDLAEPGALRDFWWRYGPELQVSNRETAFRLTRLFGLSRSGSPESARELVAAIVDLGPTANDYVEFKRDLLKRRDEPSAEKELLVAILAASAQSSALNVESLRLRERAASLASGSPELAIALLDRVPAKAARTAAVRATAEGLSDGLGTTATADLAASHPDALMRLVRIMPETAAEPAIWRSSKDAAALWRAVKTARPAEAVRRAITVAMIEGSADVDAEEVLGAWPRTSEFVVDLLAQEKIPEEVVVRWAPALVPSDLEHLSDTAALPERLVETLVNVWSSERLLTAKPSIWNRLTSVAANLSTRGALAVFLASLERRETAAATIACRTYDLLYVKAARNELDDGSRATLRRAADDIPPWDAARQLARLLSKAFRRNEWPRLVINTLTNSAGYGAALLEDRTGELAAEIAIELATSAESVAAGRVPHIVEALNRSSHDRLLNVAEAMLLAKASGSESEWDED